MITVAVNGEERQVEQGATVAGVVGEWRRGVAAAVNGTVVRRGDWDVVELRDGDRVEVLGAVQGG